MEVPGLYETISLLAAAVGVGGVLSFLFEHFAFFQDFSAKAKWNLIFAVSLGLPLLAQVLIQFVPAQTWAALEPYWRSVAFGFLAWAGSQGTHKLLNNR